MAEATAKKVVDQELEDEIAAVKNAPEEEAETPATEEEEVQETTESTDGSDKEESSEESEEESEDDSGKDDEDPTKGMTDAQAREYWRNEALKEKKRAKHFEGDYKKERTKRQRFQKGLLSDPFNISPAAKPAETPANQKPISQISDPTEYADRVLDEATNRVRQEMTEVQLTQRMNASEKWAKEEYDGSDGRPTYDEIIEKHVGPYIENLVKTDKAQAQRLMELFKHAENPAEAVYTFGLIRMGPDGVTKKAATKAREDLVKKVDEAAKKAATLKSKADTGKVSKKQSKAEIESMSLEDFEKEIAKAKGE